MWNEIEALLRISKTGIYVFLCLSVYLFKTYFNPKESWVDLLNCIVRTHRLLPAEKGHCKENKETVVGRAVVCQYKSPLCHSRVINTLMKSNNRNAPLAPWVDRTQGLEWPQAHSPPNFASHCASTSFISIFKKGPSQKKITTNGNHLPVQEM